MIILANNKRYRLGISGDKDTKSKLESVMQKADQTKRKLEALNRINISPTFKIKDEASSKIDALEAKINKIKNLNTTVTVNAKVNGNENENEDKGGLGSKISGKINDLVKAGGQKIASFSISGIEASLKNYSNYEKTLTDIRVASKATDGEMRKLDETAKKLGSSAKWSAVDVSEAEKTLIKAGISVQDTVSALPSTLDLATASGMDLAAAADVTSTTLSSFNLKGSDSAHVADVLASSASSTKSDLSELGDTMKYMSPVSSSLGISFEDTAVAAGLLSGQNIKGSQAAAMLKQTIGKLSGPTKEAAEMMKKYGINAYDGNKKLKPLSGIIDNLNNSLGNLPDEEKEGAIASIFGIDNMSGILALMNEGGESLGQLSQKAQNANGLMKEMANTKTDTLSGQWDRLKAAATTMSVTLGEKLAPYAKQFVDWLIEKMPVIEDKIMGIVDYVSKHTEDVKALAKALLGLGAIVEIGSTIGKVKDAFDGIKGIAGIFKGAGIAAEAEEVAGGLSKVGVIGRLLPLIFNPVGLAVAATLGVIGVAVVTNNNLMKKNLSTTTEELGPLEQIMNELHGHIYKSKEEMQQLGLAYDDFGDKISDDFKSKVEESTKSIKEFQLYINKINLDGKIDDNESSEFDNKVNEMCNNSIKTIEDSKAKYQDSMKSMFNDDGTFSDAEKATLEYLSKDYDNRITKEQQIKDKIYDIRKNAVNENRKLNDEDIQNIKDYQTQMAQIALESAGGNKDELLYAKNKFAARAKGLDLNDGSALAQEAAKDRDDRIVDVKAKYDTNIEKMKAELVNAESDPNATQDTKDKIKAAIAENEQAEFQKISEINKLWNENMDTLYKMSPNLKGKLNKYDGSILSGNDVTNQSDFEEIKKKYSELNGVTQEGYYGVRDKKTGAMNSVYVSVDERTKEITGIWNTTTDEIGAYTDKMKDKLKELEGSDQKIGNTINYLGNMNASIDTTNGTVKAMTGDTIGKLQSISTDIHGVTTSIAVVNGTPIQIKSDVNGAILNIKEVTDAANNIPQNENINVSSNAEQTTSQVSELVDKAKEADGKSFTVTGIFKQLGKWVFGNSDENIPTNYTGTTNGTRGINSVAERGFEIVMGRQLRWFNGGEKVLNHEQSKAFLENQQNNEPFQVKQGQFQLMQPQFQAAAGAGGVSVGDIQVTVNGNQDADGIVDEVVQVVGYKLKEALTNIKK